MLKHSSTVFGAFILCVALAARSPACTPQPATVEYVVKVLAGSDHAFRGTVAEIAAHPTDAATGRVRFVVERIYKGAPASGEWYRYVKFSTAHCGGWTPDTGQRAIFFIYRHQGETWATLLYGLYDNQDIMAQALRAIEDKR